MTDTKNTEITKPEDQDDVLGADAVVYIEDFELAVTVRELQRVVHELGDPQGSSATAKTLANTALQRIRDLRLLRIEYGISHESERKHLR